MEVGVASRESSDTGVRTRDEVVVHDVDVAITITSSGNVATATSPVVDDLQY